MGRRQAKRLLVIGLDGGMLTLVERFMSTGRMPRLAQLVRRGALTESLPSIPVDTPTNWTTIMTGAEPSTHGVYSFTTHIAGEPIDRGQVERTRNKQSTFCKAQFLWNTLEAAGRRVVVVNYPTGWPSTMRQGLVVGGVTPGGEPWRLAKAVAYSTGPPTELATDLSAIKFAARPLHFRPSRPWPGISPGRGSVLEGEAALSVGSSSATLHVLLVSTSGDGYDQAVLATDPLSGAPLAILRDGEWSPWLEAQVDGIRAVFRVKLARLSRDGRDVQLYLTDVFSAEGWTDPPGLEAGIRQEVGPYLEGLESPYVPVDVQVRPYGPVNVSPGLLLEHARMQAHWMVNLTGYLRTTVAWDALILHYHYLDTLNHTYLGYLYDRFPLTTVRRTREAWDLYGESYAVVDALIGGMVDAGADDETLVVVTSDHAALPCWRYVAITHALARAGLLAYEWDAALGRYRVDLKHSRAVPYLDPQHVWVNLQGREPEGIVPPGHYERVRDAVIEALLAIRDPDTGEPPVRLAVRREDLGILGKAQERAGDVLFFLRPGYTTWDGTIESLRFHEISPDRMARPLVTLSEEVVGHHTPHLPAARLDQFQNSAFTLFCGPGIRESMRREFPIRLTDVAPTIAYLMGIPGPADAQGAVVRDLLE